MQFAALCWRVRRGRVEVLLVTTRRTQRWIAPKGWPIEGLTPAETAAREAWEEAGATGRHREGCLGRYIHRRSAVDEPPAVVTVFPLEVWRLAPRYPEAGQRQRKWLSRRKAAARAAEPGLARIIAAFDPAALSD